jgi:RNase H-like domain found in reverse transcriptase/Reverse transcriptase (RNA-dependent DNA polymerase)
MTLAEEKALEDFLDENLKKGFIHESKSPQAAPLFFVPKKNGKLRLCKDYQYLNKFTIKNAYPIPRTQDLLDKIGQACIFTKLDLKNGYNNIRIAQGDEWKAAFSTPRGLFEPTVMFFGLCNSPATFQAYMNDTFSDFIKEGWLIAYLDDIMVLLKDQVQDRANTRRLLEQCREQRLRLNIDKCEFGMLETDYLGFHVSPNGVLMELEKLDAIMDWLEPTTLKQVQGFLGFANFYRRFIPSYSEMVEPLNRLTKKTQAWIWGEEQQKAFDMVKAAFRQHKLMMVPDRTKPFILETDASLIGVAAALIQKDSEGNERPCAFFLVTLNQAQQNYKVYDWELLAIHSALKYWQHYLEGHPTPVLV